MLANIFELNSFLYEFYFSFLVHLSEIDDSGQLARGLEGFALIQTVVSEELEGSVAIRNLTFGKAVELLFYTSILLGERMVD
jgi:hypothetical protein